VGSVRESRTRLLGQRPRPALVSLYAWGLGEAGLLGRASRRRLGRLLGRGIPAATALGLATLLALRAFAAPDLGWRQAVAGGVLLAVLAGIARRRTRDLAAGRRPSAREQLELGSLVLVAGFAVAQLSESAAGEADPPLFPVVYLAMAFLVAFLPRSLSLALALVAAGLEAAVWRGRGGAVEDLPALAAHAAFILLFALLFHAVLAARVAASRRAERSAVERRLREIEERAREYRLLAPGEGEAGDAAERERRFAEASVVEIEAAVRGVLEVAEVALRAHTAAVYLLSADDRELWLRECRSRSDRVARGPLPGGEGPLGGAVRRRAAVRLCGDIRSANHYEDGTRPGALLAVPLLDRRGGHVRGALLVDRMEATGFSDEDERLLATLAGELLRAVEAERLLADLKRGRDEKERFYQAIERLNRVTTRSAVIEELLRVAAEMVELQFGAVTLVDGSGARRRHRVARCHLPEAEGGAGRIEGLEFGDNPGLVAQAARLGATLPGREIRPEATVIFDENTRLRGLSSIKVVPLKSGERVLGTLVVGTRRRPIGPDQVRQLEVVALQAGASLDRASLFERTEQLATTDGLTGLLNHRTFQERLDAELLEAQRYDRKLSLLLADVDHFKSVNDTYGHPAGDQVLRGVARILAQEARATDLVARHGGEEFAIVMPETDSAGARVIAERIRERVAAEGFDTGLGPLRVTISLGVATFPVDAGRKGELLEAADGCLYAAKRGGRNRTAVAAPRAARRAPPARRSG
jgi:diguanylate cyclase (GGDEF)-like protein